MTSGKQKKAQLKISRKAKADKRVLGFAAGAGRRPPRVAPPGEALVNASAHAGSATRDMPEFMLRGTYRDLKFTCIDCGTTEVWTATQQKWWYEVAKGDLNASAVRCRPCRAKERARKIEARRVHLEGVARKKQTAKNR